MAVVIVMWEKALLFPKQHWNLLLSEMWPISLMFEMLDIIALLLLNVELQLCEFTSSPLCPLY